MSSLDEWTAWIEGNMDRERDAAAERAFVHRALAGLLDCLRLLQASHWQLSGIAQSAPRPSSHCPAADYVLEQARELEKLSARVRALESAKRREQAERKRAAKPVRVLRPGVPDGRA
jgi:hypothetical protein